MKMHSLDLALPPVAVTTVRDGAEPACEPGDFLLSRAHGFKHKVIKWGQGLRLRGDDKRYAGYTHAALVSSATGDLIEAVGEGVRMSSLAKYMATNEVYQVVHIMASAEDRQQVVDFASAVLAARAPYGFLANVSITLWAFTGSRLTFFLDGSYTCSGLVASALERTSAKFGMNAARVMPAQLAVFFTAPPPPSDPPRATRGSSSWFRRRRG